MHSSLSFRVLGTILAAARTAVLADGSTEVSASLTSSDITASASLSTAIAFSSGIPTPANFISTSATIGGSSTLVSSSATQSATVIPVDTRDSWWFPLLGLSDDKSIRWGANVSTLNRKHVNGDVSPDWKAFEIVVNDTNPVPPEAPEIYDGPQIIVNSDSDIHSDGSLVVTTNGDQTLVLGPNSALNLTEPSFADDLIIPTVPFGINYGHHGVWNGSVTLGSRYDANRIASTSWTLIPETTEGNSTFLKDGTQRLNVTLLFRGKSTTLPGLLDINNDALILPSSVNCTNLVIESLTVNINSATQADPLLKVVIPSNLTSSADRCIQLAEHDPNNNRVVLGRPFFQAAYAYVDARGRIYLAAAHQYDLGIDARPFDAKATLSPAAQPPSPSPPAPSPTQNAARKVGVAGSLGGFFFGFNVTITSLALGVSWIAMNI